MSAGADLLARAHAASPSAADTLAVQAIQADPDLGAAYALRGRLAAQRGDVVAAAHHYRVAYARGDQSAETRALLAACVAAAGDPAQASRIGQGARLPAALEAFAELVAMQGGGLRGVLSSALPPRGTPALLPGEASTARAPRASSGPPRSASLPPRSPSLPPRSASLPPRAASLPPRAEPAARVMSGRRQRTVNLGSPAPTPAPTPAPAPRRPAAPTSTTSSWLEDSHTERATTTTTTAGGGAASWLEDDFFAGTSSSGAVDTGGIELAWDPGELEVEARSPVTGRVIHYTELVTADRGAVMPVLSGPAFSPEQAAAPSAPPARMQSAPPARAPSTPAAPLPAGPDPFEAHEPLTAAGIANLRLALSLPGPVITATGQRPQQLGKAVALGLTHTELVLGEPMGRTPPVRIGFAQLRRLDVVRGGEQLSFLLADSRQLHLDLRELLGRAPALARTLIDELAVSLGAVGAQVVQR